ncbi:MAG: hypothetical protein M1816_006982 [Peltula sp. TS41687]|nr:MAG: hypothetical protein M1816_006982 [Peltula sp. TS41687]
MAMLTIGGDQMSSNRASHRASTYSESPSLAGSDTTIASSTDPALAGEVRHYTEKLARLESKRLQQQRYIPSREKTESLSQLALQAKLERALGRRMTGQDAVLRSKVIDEKPRFTRTTSAPAAAC